MKKAVIIFFILSLLNSCNFFNSIDNNIQTKNVEFNKDDIIGKWKLDKFSYKYLYSEKDIDSVFKQDKTFTLNNSKNLFKTSLQGKIKNGAIDNKISNGKWNIIRYEYREQIDMTLELIYEDNTKQVDLNVYKKKDEYQIWYFFGDPDIGQRLRFLKIE